ALGGKIASCIAQLHRAVASRNASHRHERYLNLIPLIWPAVLALLLVILLQAASRSRALVIVVYIAVAIWLAVLVLCSRTGVPSWVVAGFDGHEMAGIQGQNLVMVGSHQADRGGQIMKMLTREHLFVSAKRARKTKDWFERAKLVVVAARDRAVETAQQRAVPSKKRPPTVLQRRRLAERLVSAKSPGQCQSSSPLTSSY